MSILYWKERELRSRYATSSAWHARRQPIPLPDWEHTEPKLVLPFDAFALAALHLQLVKAHRYADATLALNKLRDLATRPQPKVIDTHQFVVQKQDSSIPIVQSS